MRRYIVAAVVAVMSCSALSAQSLNQTVQIENTYEVSSKASRISLPLTVPDSLRSFDYKFDYQVFETPYKGAFEFSPYRMELTPNASETVDPTRFYLRAGAGFPVRPELFAAFCPVSNETVSLSFRQALQGYWGQYRTARTSLTASSPLMTTKGVRYNGYDIRENFGADLKWNIGENAARVNLDYCGLFNEDYKHTSGFNSVGARVGFGARERIDNNFYYDFSLYTKFSQDALTLNAIDVNPLVERIFGLSGTVTPRIKDFFGLLVDFDLSYCDYGANGADYDNSFFAAYVSPKIDLVLGPVDFTAGVNLSFSPAPYLAPDLCASVKIADKSRFYLLYKGGMKVNTYSSLKLSNQWLFPGMGDSLKHSLEKLNLTAGFSGSVLSRLQYEVSGGYMILEDDPNWGLLISKSSPKDLDAALVFQSWKGWKADVKLTWKSERFDADASVAFRGTDILSGNGTVTGFSAPTKNNYSVAAFDLPLASGNARVVYNWKRKFFVGARCEFSTERKLGGFVGEVPVGSLDEELLIQPFIDLGVYAEYRFSDKFSVYVQGVNLLSESVQKLPLHIENGIGVTGGITLTL